MPYAFLFMQAVCKVQAKKEASECVLKIPELAATLEFSKLVMLKQGCMSKKT